MDNCQERPTFFPEAVWKSLINLPALRYMKAPVDRVEHLYRNYPTGNEKGTFAFVHDENTFYTYHPRGWNRSKWEPIAGGIESFFEIDIEFLKEGDTLVYDSNKKKFVVKSGNVWNKLIDKASSVVQVNKFLNEVEEIPTIENDAGIYFIHKDNESDKGIIEFRAFYLIIDTIVGKKVIKIWNSSEYRTKIEVDAELAKKANQTQVDADLMALKKIIDGINEHYKGYFPTETELKNKYPISDDGDYAYVGSTGTIWNVTNGIWKDTGFSIPIEGTEILNYFSIVQNEEFLFAICDGNNRVVWGIRQDLRPYELRLGTETNKELVKLLRKIENADIQIDTIEGKIELINNLVQTISNKQFVEYRVDKDGRLLSYVTKDGTHYFEKIKLPQTVFDDIKEIIDIQIKYIEEKLTVVNSILQIANSEQFLQYSVDKDGRLLSYVTKDGTHYFEKIKLPQDILDKINIGNYNNKSSEQSLQIDFPKSLGRVVIHDLTISSLSLNKSSKFGRISLFIDGVWATKILEISYQGSSSMNFPEKNFSIDIYNEDGSDFMIKVGKWVATNKFHFKVNWIDATHCRNVGANRIYENMLQTKPVDKIRAWNVPYHWQNGTMDEQIETGAMGHIDGFPIELYFEDEYYGIATLNLTKNRRNYNMNKKDNGSNGRLRIQLELGGGINANCDWTRLNFADFEVRNPDVKTIDGGKYFEGADIEDGAVKNAAQRLFDWLNSVSEADFKTQANDYLMIDSLIDYILLQELTQNSDSWTRNGQLCTWDGLRWTVLPYDLDQAFGLGGTGVMAINANGNSLPLDDKGNSVFWLRILKLYKAEIEARYKELRDLGVFSYKGIETTLRGIVDVIGFEAYKRDLTKWDKPSFRPESYIVPNPNGFHVSGGFYTSLSHIMTWVEQRLAKLDNDYNYN